MLENNFNKEMYENGDVRLEVHHRGDDERHLWLQVGIAGLWITNTDAQNMLELISALLEEEEQNG